MLRPSPRTAAPFQPSALSNSHRHEPGVARHEQFFSPINSSAIFQEIELSLFKACNLSTIMRIVSGRRCPRHHQNHILHFLSHPTSLLLKSPPAFGNDVQEYSTVRGHRNVGWWLHLQSDTMRFKYSPYVDLPYAAARLEGYSFSVPTTSQWPPLSGPMRRRRPEALSFEICSIIELLARLSFPANAS